MTDTRDAADSLRSSDTSTNDLTEILAITNTDVDEVIHAVADHAPAIFTWDYEKGRRPALNKLYEKAKHSQWNGETDLDWSIEVDQEHFAKMLSELRAMEIAQQGISLAGTPFASWGRRSGSPCRWRRRTGA